MFSRYGYAGANPLGDGRLKLVSDGAGDTQVWFNMDGLTGASGNWLITTLDGVNPASLQVQNGLVAGLAGSGGPSPSGAAGISVSTSDAYYWTPAGVTAVTLTGSGQTVAGNDLGDTFTSNNSGNHIAGGAGADTFNLGRGGDVVTGGGGTDTFAFGETPWAGGHITDFAPGQDRLNLGGMFAHYGYAGSNPLADGRLSLVADGLGDTQVWFNMDGLTGASGAWLVTTLDHVNPASLHVNGGWIS
jgi:Ca2+-binding RTX toxin-like protein